MIGHHHPRMERQPGEPGCRAVQQSVTPRLLPSEASRAKRGERGLDERSAHCVRAATRSVGALQGRLRRRRGAERCRQHPDAHRLDLHARDLRPSAAEPQCADPDRPRGDSRHVVHVPGHLRPDPEPDPGADRRRLRRRLERPGLRHRARPAIAPGRRRRGAAAAPRRRPGPLISGRQRAGRPVRPALAAVLSVHLLCLSLLDRRDGGRRLAAADRAHSRHRVRHPAACARCGRPRHGAQRARGRRAPQCRGGPGHGHGRAPGRALDRRKSALPRQPATGRRCRQRPGCRLADRADDAAVGRARGRRLPGDSWRGERRADHRQLHPGRPGRGAGRAGHRQLEGFRGRAAKHGPAARPVHPASGRAGPHAAPPTCRLPQRLGPRRRPTGRAARGDPGRRAAGRCRERAGRHRAQCVGQVLARPRPGRGLGARAWQDPPGRRRPRALATPAPRPPCRLPAAGRRAVRGHGGREHRALRGRRHVRADHRRRPRRRRPRHDRQPAGRLRHPDRRWRGDPVRRAAPAHRPRARPVRRPVPGRARRAQLQSRRRWRAGADQGGAGHQAAQRDRDRGGASPQRPGRGRPGPGPEAGQGRGIRPTGRDLAAGRARGATGAPA